MLVPHPNFKTKSFLTAGDKENSEQEMAQSHLTLSSKAIFLCNGLRKEEDMVWLVSSLMSFSHLTHQRLMRGTVSSLVQSTI